MGVVSIGKNGIVYAALFSDGLVKIGCTRNDKQRMQSLSYARQPYELLIFVTAVSRHYNLRVEEKSFHDLFSDRKVKGEYFIFFLEDWLEWFAQWNSVDYAFESGLFGSIAQHYDTPSNPRLTRPVGNGTRFRLSSQNPQAG